MGVATVAAMTFGLAPGYWARTTTDGGTTSGYSEIGSARRASRPETKMSIDRTPAKIGRSMKNLERFMSRSRGEGGDAVSALGEIARARLGIHGDRPRGDHNARTDALQSVHEDAFHGLQARLDDAKAAGQRTQGHLPQGPLVFRAHN